jgi:hypothetical protein
MARRAASTISKASRMGSRVPQLITRLDTEMGG